jgi:hypothetical protein
MTTLAGATSGIRRERQSATMRTEIALATEPADYTRLTVDMVQDVSNWAWFSMRTAVPYSPTILGACVDGVIQTGTIRV